MMGDLWGWGKEGLVKFSGFQAIIFGRTLVEFFKIITFVLGCQDYGRIRMNKIKVKRKVIYVP